MDLAVGGDFSAVGMGFLIVGAREGAFHVGDGASASEAPVTTCARTMASDPRRMLRIRNELPGALCGSERARGVRKFPCGEIEEGFAGKSPLASFPLAGVTHFG